MSDLEKTRAKRIKIKEVFQPSHNVRIMLSTAKERDAVITLQIASKG
ncbi:hypothetical protein VINI7043_01470 [Vibrio nigripulchritudo ATCC 27043]|nr:hypothetical protein VINI7043_01470 [Vibrio nigripulchritudo ATCC 27043]